jgi:hypothetical protein
MAKEDLKAAVKGGQQKGGNKPFAGYPELDKLYNVDFSLPVSQGEAGASAYSAGVQLTNSQREKEAGRQAEIQRLQQEAQKIQDMSDPSKYQRIRDKSGGYQFLDPTGKSISAEDYADITGRNPADVLRDSQNPIDVAFQQDYDRLQQYMEDKANAGRDGEAKKRAQEVEKAVGKAYGIDLNNANPQDLMEKFRRAYPTVFGLNTTGPQGTSTLLPDNISSGGGYTGLGGGGISDIMSQYRGQ